MSLLFLILIILACVVLCLIVLVQNPKGGGLASNIGGFSNQYMGVKQTTDVLEKGTWIFAAVIAVLCITSAVFIPGSKAKNESTRQAQQQQTTAPATAPASGTTAPTK